MRYLPIPLFAALAQSLAPSLAVPILDNASSPSTLSPRGSQYCSNAPNTVAGTPLSPLSASPLSPRIPPGTMIGQIWCAPGSSTYAIITWQTPLAAAAVNNLLTWAHNTITNYINTVGDGLVPHGAYQLAGEGLELYLENTGNHQQTWGVVNAAIVALAGFQMTGSVGPMAVVIQVYDGMHFVGRGFLRAAG